MNCTFTESAAAPFPTGEGANVTVPVPEQGRTRLVGIARATPYAARSTVAVGSCSTVTRIAVALVPVAPSPEATRIAATNCPAAGWPVVVGPGQGTVRVAR